MNIFCMQLAGFSSLLIAVFEYAQVSPIVHIYYHMVIEQNSNKCKSSESSGEVTCIKSGLCTVLFQFYL